jgi:hypothetical protein
MKSLRKTSGTREFIAAVERKLPGDEVELHRNSGWDWIELTFVDQTSGGAPLAHRDALKLLAAMIQHTDTKPQQQRILCLDRVHGRQPQQDGGCAQPFMMINDLGKTFGRANLTNGDGKSAANFEEWSKVPVWKGDKGCVAHLSKSFSGTLKDPVIGEGGRQFLAGLLAQLTDSQLRDLFEVARFTRRDPDATVDDWVRVFKEKRDAIATRRCTNPTF